MAAVLALLVAVGAAAWWLELRPEPRAEPASLGELPPELGLWVGEDLPLEQAVESMLDATFNVQRVYMGLDDELLWLYVGYYSTRRGGTPEHVPRVCYVSAGWEIERHRVVPVEGDPDLRVNELIVSQGGERRLVHYWFRSFRSTGLLSPLRLEIDHALGRLTEGRADGALVRLSTPLSRGDEQVARSLLQRFALELEPALGRAWPPERFGP